MSAYDDIPSPSDDVWGELDSMPSAWLSEVTFTTLSWHQPTVSGWTAWVHGIWPVGADIPPEYETVEAYSTVREEHYLLGRTLEPSSLPLAQALASPPPGALALVVLTLQYLVPIPLPQPMVVPGGPLFPMDSPDALRPGIGMRHPMLTAAGCTADGNTSFMARFVDMENQEVSDKGIDLLEKGGVISLQPSHLPMPWLRLAMAGTSGVSERGVPVSPHMPVLSLWLNRLVLASEEPDDIWTTALELFSAWSLFTTWDAVLSDQLAAHELGVLVPLDVAERVDALLLGLVVLTETPAPTTYFSPLMALLSPSRRRDVAKLLSHYPDHAIWLTPEHPSMEPTPWR